MREPIPGTLVFVVVQNEVALGFPSLMRRRVWGNWSQRQSQYGVERERGMAMNKDKNDAVERDIAVTVVSGLLLVTMMTERARGCCCGGGAVSSPCG